MIKALFDQTQGNGLKARLIREGMGSASIQMANRLLVLVLGIVLARGLGAEGYGVYAYAFAIMSLLMVLAEAGVPTLLMREVAAAQSSEAWGLMRGVLCRAQQFVLLVSVTVSLIGFGVLAVFAIEMQIAVLYTTALILLILPLAALIKTKAHAIRGLHRVVLGQTLEMLMHPMLVLTLVAIGFFLWPSLREPYYAMAAQFVGFAVVFIVTSFLLRRLLPAETRSRPAEYRERAWMKSALPFTLIGGMLVLSHQADIVMLGWFAASGEVGTYRVAVQGSVLVAFTLHVLNAVFSPYFAKFYAEQNLVYLQRMVTVSARAILALSFPLVLVFFIWGDWLAAFVFGTEFAESHHPLVILSVGQFLAGGFGCIGVLMSMSGRERLLARSLWASTLLNVGLNLILIPIYSGVGAALATSISWLFLHMILFLSVKRNMGVSCHPF